MQVMSVKALGIALKLTFSGSNQFLYAQTWFFAFVLSVCVIMQLNFLNKVILDFIFKSCKYINSWIFFLFVSK